MRYVMVDESIFYDSFEDIFKTLVDFVCVYKRYVNVNCRSVRMHKRCKIVHSHLLMKSLCSRVHRFLGAYTSVMSSIMANPN